MNIFSRLTVPRPVLDPLLTAPSDPLHVFIATMAYNPCEMAMTHSRTQVERDLAANGIKFTQHVTSGDSLVTRGRHGVMTDFLESTASHLLWWDADIEATQLDVVRCMLETGHDVIGGACPVRGDSGRVVVTLRPEDRRRKKIDTDDYGCVKVEEVGTGFMLVNRKAIVTLCTKHPELFYRSDLPDEDGVSRKRPMWALFDTAIIDQRYLSEDYMFCKRWRDAGGDVYVFAPAEFRHWGKKAYTGSFMSSLQMREA